MRSLEDIETDLAAAREALSLVEGTPAEVYSRIVGYYRSVRNWNLGKREEYGERRLYRISEERLCAASSPSFPTEKSFAPAKSFSTGTNFAPKTEPGHEEHLLLFVRPSCPGCPPAKAAAERLGIPVNLVNADTEEGMTEAVRRNVLSTPMAILLSPEGKELKRAANAEAIGKLFDTVSVAHAEPIAV